jgi:hypothetical protein
LSGTDPEEDWQFATKSYVDTTSGTLQYNIDNKADITYVDSSITNVSGNLQSNIDDKADITYVDNSVTTLSGNLQTEIDAKAESVHAHTESDITDLDKYTQAEVDNVVSTVSGTLQSQIDDKSDVGHAHTESDITDLDKYTQAEVDTISGSLSAEIDADISSHESSYDHDKLHDRSHAITSTADHTAGNWKVLYTDGSGNVQELALGADGDSLVSNGPAAAPYFTTISGGGAGPTGPLAAVQARRTTSYTLTGSYVDITLDTTDVESDTAVLEHNDTNTDRIDVKEDGTYLIIYGGTAQTTASNDVCRFEAQVRVNDSSAVNGSYSTSATFEDSSIDGAFEDVRDYLSHSFLAQLSAGDFVTLQFRYASGSNGANILANTTTFKIIKLEATQGAPGQDGQDGQDGAPGPPGTGSAVNVYDDGTPVSGTPFSVLNFDGATISGSPTISGGVDITVAAGEHEHEDYATSAELATTSGTLQSQIDGKADDPHTHTESDITDLDKYTQAEVDTISGTLSAEIDSDISTHEAGSSHDSRYYTESELDGGQLDNRYYTESEIDAMGFLTTISGGDHSELTNLDYASSGHTGFAPTSHSHTESDISDLQDYVTEVEFTTYSGTLQTQIDGKADIGHTHTESDITDLDKYTQAEVDTISGSLSAEIDADISTHESSYDHTKLHDRSHAITSTADHTAGNWKVLYTDGSGNIVELALGADGDSLVSNGPAAAPYFTTISGGPGPTGPLAAVQARRTTAYTLTSSYVDITFDTTDVESNTAVLEHNDTNTDRIDVKENGTYLVIYGGTAQTTSSNDTCRFEAQVRVNDSSAINGSYATSATFEDSSIDGAFEDVRDYLSHSFLATLSAGDFITLQLRYASGSNGANILANTAGFKIIKLEGSQGADGQDGQDGQDGAPGPPGTGSTINVYEDGTPVSGTPFGVLNFDGATISGSPTISGGVDITVAAGEHEHEDYVTSDELATTSGTLQDQIDTHSHGGGFGDELPCLQIRRGTSYVFTTSFADITFDITDIENDTTVLQHNDTNTDRIDVKEDGLYKITYTMPVEPDASALFTARMRKNDTTIIPGSQMHVEDSNDIDELSNDFIADLSSGDFLTLQLKSTVSDNGNVNADIIVTVIKLQGAKGDQGEQGEPGSGASIQVYDDGTPVSGTPFSVLNFDGATISGSPTISGGVDITVSAGDHNHDDRYYTETEVDTISGTLQTNIDGKDDIGHTHTESDITDLDKYTQAEVDATILTVSGTLSSEIDSDITTHEAGSSHDSRYYTESELDAGQLDNRYYTESEVDTISGTLSAEIDADITTHEAGSSHDSRYYTESEIDAMGFITTVSGGDHSEMTNLDYASSGHTGFAAISHSHTESDITDLGDYATSDELATTSGTLQDQIDTHSHGGGSFGTEFHEASSEGENTTTSSSYQQKLRLTTSDLPSGTYYIQWYYEIEGDGRKAHSRVELDDTTELHYNVYDSSIAGYIGVSGFKIESSFSGVHTIDIDWRSNGSDDIDIRRARLTLWRIS